MKRKLLYIVFSLATLALWQYFGSTNQTVRLLLSSPTLVANHFIENAPDLLLATWTTSAEAVAGLAIATVFSFVAMTVCFYRPSIMDFFLPIMVTSQIIPLIVLAPFFIILLGTGLTSKIAMASVMSFFPIFVNFAHGYNSIGPNVHELLKIYHAPLHVRILRVYFPLSTSSIFAGLKISATLAVIGAIVAEFNGADIGLGKNLYISAKRLEPDLMMTSLLLATAVGGGLYSIVLFIEKRLGGWYA